MQPVAPTQPTMEFRAEDVPCWTVAMMQPNVQDLGSCETDRLSCCSGEETAWWPFQTVFTDSEHAASMPCFWQYTEPTTDTVCVSQPVIFIQVPSACGGLQSYDADLAPLVLHHYFEADPYIASQNNLQGICQKELCKVQNNSASHEEGLLDIRNSSQCYASSDESIPVSRSSHRRRCRRLAKANACGSSVNMLSCEEPDVLVSEQRKKELMHHLEIGGETRRRIISGLYGSVRRMSYEASGTRVVQYALDVANKHEREALVSELHGHVREAISSPHANFVIQKVVEVLPAVSASFVAEELRGFAAEMAQHKFGCRVLCRLVEHLLCSGNSVATSDLIDELLLAADQLLTHSFARHVLELILEHGNSTHKQKIVHSVQRNVFGHAKNRNASYVVEKVLVTCSMPDTCAITSHLLSKPDLLLELAAHECGSHVVKAVLRTHGEFTQEAKQLILASSDYLRKSKYGQRLLEDLTG